MKAIKKPIFKRYGRSPNPKNSSISKLMSSVSLRGSRPEEMVRKFLSTNKVLGYRLNCQGILGRPDICFKKSKIAIFIHGCFWHRCPKCDLSLPHHNRDFWSNKFEANVARDKKNCTILKKEGWEVITIWECEILKREGWKGKLLNKIENAKKKYNNSR